MYQDKTQLEEQIDLLTEAQEKLAEVVELVKMAVDGSEVEGMAIAYLIPSLEQDISDDNQWIGGQNPANLQSLIDQLTEILNEESDCTQIDYGGIMRKLSKYALKQLTPEDREAYENKLNGETEDPIYNLLMKFPWRHIVDRTWWKYHWDGKITVEWDDEDQCYKMGAEHEGIHLHAIHDITDLGTFSQAEKACEEEIDFYTESDQS